MRIMYRAVTGCLIALIAFVVPALPKSANASAHRDSYPSQPLVILEPFGVGGGPDLLARALSVELTQVLHQSVSVQNVVGGGATAAPTKTARSPADGYTLLINTNAQAYSRAARSDLQYDPLRDFIPVRALTKQPYVLVTGKLTGFRSLADLIAAARANPHGLTFGSMGVGTGIHIGAERLNIEAGIHARHIPASSKESIADVLANAASGKFSYCFAPISLALASIRTGDLIPLGVSTSGRSHLLPDVPSISEAGVPQFDFPLWYGIWVRSGTPTSRVTKLDRALAAAMSRPTMRAWLQTHGAEPLRLSRTQFRSLIRADCHQAAKILNSDRC